MKNIANLEDAFEKVRKNRNLIDKTKNFILEVDEVETYQVKVNHNVTQCTNCPG